MNGRPSKKRGFSKRGKKPSTDRRIVTGTGNGKAVVQSDEQMEPYQFKTVPGYQHALIWRNTATPGLGKEQRLDRYPDSVVPGPGGASLHVATFPPASVFSRPEGTALRHCDQEAGRARSMAQLLASAERELSAFITAVNNLFGAELARQAGEDWLEELEQTDFPSAAPVLLWRRVTIAAASRLAGRVNGHRSRD